ncbi:MAG TPA: hypothetical protein VMB05_05020 [Solirubrobacteraceae bacterium]|nr:hypothetical protein [Solirubrobacteraceae bacterium]
MDDLEPAEREALQELEDARLSVERAELRLFLVSAGAKRRRTQKRHLHIIPPQEPGPLCEGRR